MRILHVIHRYPPAQGGSEKYFAEISRRFVNQGHSVEVWTTDADDLESFWIKGKKRLPSGHSVTDGVEISRFKTVVLPQHTRLQRLFCLLPSQAIRRLFHFPSPLVPGLALRALRGSFQFDVVHACALPYTSILLAAYWASRRAGCPLFFSPFMHTGESEQHDLRKWYARPDQISLLAKASRVFVQTPSEKSFLVSCGLSADLCVRTGVGIDPLEVMPPVAPPPVMRERYGLAQPYVFTLGAKSVDKGTPTVVDAMRKVWEKRPDVTLVLAGDEMSDFVSFWRTVPNEIQSKILRLGRVTDEERIDLFRGGDIYLNPSRTDSFGTTFLEAWIWGKPVIGARAGGVVDVVSDGEDGYLIEFGNAAQLAERVLSLLENADLRSQMGSAGKRKTLANYTWDIIFRKLEEEYTNAL